MKLPKPARPVAAVLVVFGLFLYLVLVDLGVNAGRVHYGVHVDGFEVGGHTFTEATALLAERGEQLQENPVVYRIGTFSCGFTPRMIGWGPQPHDTAEAAMNVGRPLSAIGSIGERIDAWLGGLEVEWADEPDPAKVERVIERCRSKARDAGQPLNEELLGRLFRRF